MTESRKQKFRVLRDFTDHDGKEHKAGDFIEMPFLDARAYVNSDKITADLGPQADAEPAERDEKGKGRKTRE